VGGSVARICQATRCRRRSSCDTRPSISLSSHAPPSQHAEILRDEGDLDPDSASPFGGERKSSRDICPHLATDTRSRLGNGKPTAATR